MIRNSRSVLKVAMLTLCILASKAALAGPLPLKQLQAMLKEATVKLELTKTALAEVDTKIVATKQAINDLMSHKEGLPTDEFNELSAKFYRDLKGLLAQRAQLVQQLSAIQAHIDWINVQIEQWEEMTRDPK